MYERFTDRSRKVLQLPNNEAQHFNHQYIDTEHLLLALAIERSGVAAKVLKHLGADARTIRAQTEKLVKGGFNEPDTETLPESKRLKKVIGYSFEEAQKLNHNYVSTEHLLIGLLHEQEGVAATVLTNLGLQLGEVRQEVLNVLGHGLG